MIYSMISKTIKSMITTVINPFDGLLSRYFVNLDPVLNSYYEMAAPITFTGDFEIEVEISTITTDSLTIIFASATDTDNYIAFTAAGAIRVKIGGINTDTPSGVLPIDGKLHTLKIKRVGLVLTKILDDVIVDTDVLGSVLNMLISEIARNSAGAFDYFDGIIANAKFTDKSGASDVVTSFKLDQATANTESSIEGNNSVTYINIPQSARELYTLEDDTWVGSELVTNGNFTTDLSSWSNISVNTSWDNGTMLVSSPSSTEFSARQALAMTLGASYQVNFSIVETSGGPASVYLANDAGGFFYETSIGYYSSIMTNTSSLIVAARVTTGTTVKFDNVSVKRVLEVAS